MIKWISVKKHLPRIGQRVFTCDIESEYDPKDKNSYPKNYIFITQFNPISEDDSWEWESAEEESRYIYSKNGQKCAFLTTPEETLTTSHWAVINFVVPIKAKKKQNNKLNRFEMMDL